MKVFLSVSSILLASVLGIQGDKVPNTLTSANLKANLIAAGYTPVDDSPGVEIVTITTKSGDKFPETLSVSADDSFFWIQVGFGTIPDADAANTSWLLNLLKENEDIEPGQFNIYVDKEKNHLELSVPVINQNMDSKEIRFQLNDFVKVAEGSSKYWQYPSTVKPTPSK